MMRCESCKKEIKDEAPVVAQVFGYVHRDTSITHGLDVREELGLTHWECHVAEEDKGKWKRLWDAIKSI